MNVTIVGLGQGSEGVTLRGLRALREADEVVLRTEKAGVTGALSSNGIGYTALDGLYERCEDFDELCAAIADAVLEKSSQRVAYAVPGGASIGDLTVKAVYDACKERSIPCEIVAGVGCEAEAAALAGGVDRAVILPASSHALLIPDPRQWLLVTEIDSREVASELKLRLLDSYPAECEVSFCGQNIALYALDRQSGYGYDATLAVPPLPLRSLERFDFVHLCEVIDLLRDPAGGCPWDGEQTHESLKPYVVEEAYEVVDAIDGGDALRLADELGDLILQAVFHARIASEHGDFAIGDVTTAICGKMISRHTHIFGSDTAKTAEDVLVTWEANKKKEKRLTTQSDVLRDVPRALPAVMRAQKLLKKAANAGVARSDAQAVQALSDRVDEVSREMRGTAGDLLMDAVDVARRLEDAAELALDGACKKFVENFTIVEERAASQGQKMEALSRDELCFVFKGTKTK